MKSIIQLEKMGYNFTLFNENIEISFVSGTIPDPLEAEELLKDIKDNKEKAIDFIRKREEKEIHKIALKNKYLPYSFNECYGKQLTINSFVFIQKIDGSTNWTGYRVTYDEDNEIMSEKTIIESRSFTDVIKRTEIYINNFIKFIDEIGA